MSNQRFCIIPARALEADGLKGNDLKVLCYFGKHADKNGWWRLSQVTIAKSLSIARSTVFDAINRLIGAKLLERHVVETRTGRDSAHFYRVIFDLGMPEEGVPPEVLATRVKQANREPIEAENGNENVAENVVENDTGIDKKEVVTPAAIAAPPADPEAAPPADPRAAPSITTLINDPLSRSARTSAGADGGKPPEREKNCDFEKITKVEKRKLLAAWGHFGKFNGNEENIFKAFRKLSNADRLNCLEHIRIDAYKAALKVDGKTYTTAFSTYLQAGTFDSDQVELALGRLRVEAQVKDKADNAVRLWAFGKAWMAHRLWQMKFGKQGLWKPRAGPQETLFTHKPELFSDNIRDAKWNCLTNFPARLTDESQLEGDLDSFVSVSVGGAQWDAWNAWHVANGYPPLEPRRGYDWLWVPVADPTGLSLEELTRSKNEVAA